MTGTSVSHPDPSAARAYAKLRYRLLLIQLAVGIGFLIVFQWSGASHAAARWWSARLASQPLIVLGYLAVFGLVQYLVTFPLQLYGSFVVEHRFALSRMTLKAWGVKEAKRLALGAVLGAALVEGLYALLRHAGSLWPLWATAGWVGFTVVLARVFPTVLLPIFYKTTPVQDDALVQRLLSLCRRVGVSALGVFRFELGRETRKANAALAGLGKTRRVLLADTLMDGFTPEEIEGVLAHELAHHRFRHITKLLGISAVGSWVALTLTEATSRWWLALFRVEALTDIAGFPVLMAWLSLLGLIGLPLQNALSRAFEWQADRFAVAVTDAPRAFADALSRLAALNLADPHPPRWVVWMFYDHPPIMERIQAAQGRG